MSSRGTHPVSAMVSCAHMKHESERLCSKAGLKTQADNLVSQFWSVGSRRGLLVKMNCPSVAMPRLGSRLVVEARLFGPALFEAAKLKTLFLGADKEHPDELPRIYTLTHSDITSKITLAISSEINKAQLKGWYSKLQRDEVVAEWKRVQGKMSLHVHCHISGGNFLHNLIANLRFYIFRKELPVVLEAFRHGDEELLKTYPDLDNAMVWVYFHSNVKEYNRVECWGPLVEAAKSASEEAKEAIHHAMEEMERQWPKQLWPGKVCDEPCECCSRHGTVIPLPKSFDLLQEEQKRQQEGSPS